MTSYYQSKICYAWSTAGVDANDVNRHRVFLEAEELEKCCQYRDNGAELVKWLQKKNFPPDGYHKPYDGKMDELLVEKMVSELRQVKALTRLFSALAEDTQQYTELMKAVMAATQAVYPNEISLGSSDFPHHTYTFIGTMMSYSPKQLTLNMLCVKLLQCVWMDVLGMHGQELEAKYGYSSRFTKKDIGALVHFWENPNSEAEVKRHLYELRCFVHKIVTVRRGQWLERTGDYEFYPDSEIPGLVPLMLTEEYRCRYGVDVTDVLTLIDDLFTSEGRVAEVLYAAASDMLNAGVRELTLRFENGQRVLESETLIGAAYTALAEQLYAGVRYRKCALCERYFVVGSYKTRKYCELHIGPSSEYHRRQLKNHTTSSD